MANRRIKPDNPTFNGVPICWTPKLDMESLESVIYNASIKASMHFGKQPVIWAYANSAAMRQLMGELGIDTELPLKPSIAPPGYVCPLKMMVHGVPVFYKPNGRIEVLLQVISQQRQDHA